MISEHWERGGRCLFAQVQEQELWSGPALAFCEATGRKENEEKCLSCCESYLTAPSSRTVTCSPNHYKPQERIQASGGDTAFGRLAL